jgi:hypothetical protein
LSPSRRERSVRRVACTAALLSGVLLLVAAGRAEPFEPLLALTGLLAGAMGVVAARGRDPAVDEVGIDRHGRLAVRRIDRPGGSPEHAARCLFAAPWLITIKVGSIWVPIWPDSVPASTFRRLWVHVRWSSCRTGRPDGPEADLRR